MQNADHYFTIEKPSMAEFKDRGSKFLGYAFPITSPEHFKQHLQDLKKERLINAYKSAASMALQLTPFVQKTIECYYELSFDYTQMGDVMNVVKQYGCSVTEQSMQLFCNLRIGIPKARLDEVLYKFKDLHTVGIKPCS